MERQGLGLYANLETSGMLWLSPNQIDWQQGHLSLEVLIYLYIARNPLQAQYTRQSNMQALTTIYITVELLF
jgi:hypothetical protein